MLNISPNKIEGKVDTSKFRSFAMVKDYHAGKTFTRLIIIFFILFILALFLPWTQNIRSTGVVTTLQPDQRPQNVNSVISGRIEKWYVREGNYVNKGDTLLYISEVKDDYFDPELLSRTQDQITSKSSSLDSYSGKINALENQIEALLKTKELKLEQAKNYIRQIELKIQSDSIDFQASKTNNSIAENQLERMEQLHKSGLKSLTDLESTRLKLQETQAKKISAENKLLSSRNELINAQVEINSIENQYRDKLAKTESDKYTAMSNKFDTEATVSKMENQYKNYSVRLGMHYITAPQNGYITETIKSGIGETLKEGEQLLTIMPSEYDLAVSLYIKPMDLPLIREGQPIRFIFDGWPSIAFSGWPNLSYGTFGGEVVAIDNFASPNGQYRVLVAPDDNDEAWPEGLRVGSGANGMALLKDVPIWYELWRKLNGFPADYYVSENSSDKIQKKK
ncbi:HlyD family secretion protein [Roseivirga echinicomitans]|uniref:Biotin attachment protein n=1 Tax=Roseivirga echinicomitans TaxID=296218 RepID=A0A150XVD8_9BACT|nr:HlyD family efflux transporter periplasmic adaptor subunit [Roseivirga echinicomitans]KYG82708.1 biotin attachment protein [Roseivirga echinicomitans]